MAEKKPRKPTIAQPKIKMLSPVLAGKRQRIVNINADKRNEYIQKGYKYIGLGEQEFNVTDKPKKTKKPRGLKKPKPLIGVTKPVASDTTGSKFYKRQLSAGKNYMKPLIESKIKKIIKNILNEGKEEYIDYKKLVKYANAISIICNGEYGITYYNKNENHVFICLGDSNPFDYKYLEWYIKGAISKNYKYEKFIKITIENKSIPNGLDWKKIDINSEEI